MTRLPEYYFRVRENGAVVFRVDTENRMRRIEMNQIAVVNVKNGEIKAHGDGTLSESDRQEIERWLDARREMLKARTLDDIGRTIDQLNLTATWAQQSATPEELNAVSDALLLAMHDLRSVLVRKKSQAAGLENST
ncbi:MAG: hypothetical protein LJE62_02490 [Silicimonas sp.]|jgi:hypothetical protein|nr:hypothetical protein [Silicimonas sp.]